MTNKRMGGPCRPPIQVEAWWCWLVGVDADFEVDGLGSGNTVDRGGLVAEAGYGVEDLACRDGVGGVDEVEVFGLAGDVDGHVQGDGSGDRRVAKDGIVGLVEGDRVDEAGGDDSGGDATGVVGGGRRVG